MRLDHSRDFTNRANDAPAGEARPIFMFDGATYGAMMEREAQWMGLSGEFAERFLRVRALPVPYSSGMCTDEGETASCDKRSQPCLAEFRCSECGMPIAEKFDGKGWIFEGRTVDDTTRVGHALMCSGCVQAVFKFCPHFWIAVRCDPPPFVLRQVSSAEDYTVGARGDVDALPHAPTFTCAEYAAYRAQLLRARPSTRGSA